MKDVQYIVVGKFGRSYGVKGEILVHPCTDPSSNILDYDPLYVNYKGSWQELQILSLKYNGKHFLMSLENFASPETVSALTNVEIAITRQQLRPLKKDEYYCIDLIGTKVQNSAGFEFGTVVDIMPTGSNDVLVIKSAISNKKYLIPYILNKYISAIDLNNKKIIADWDPEF
jgi:16S rRNA processing protein RimM